METIKGKEAALKALAERRAHQPKHIDNGSLYAGSPMYYYCRSCGWLAACLPEDHLESPPHYCRECELLKDHGWLE